MISSVVFSKDRACQLNLLLESINKNGSNLFNVTVIDRASSPSFEDGYNILIKNHTDIHWVKQESPPSDFRNIALDTIKNSGEFICFFVDDNIIYRDIGSTTESIRELFEYFEQDTHPLLCLSLRLGANTKIQNEYSGKLCPLPEEVMVVNEKYIIWDWTRLQPHTNFAYPFSVDGHIYKTEQVLRMLTYDFDTPNGLEGSGEFDVDLPPFMACFDESVVVNSPVNIVGSSANSAGKKYGMELEEVIDLFLSGHAIDLDSMDFSDVRGCHQEIQYQFNGEIKC